MIKKALFLLYTVCFCTPAYTQVTQQQLFDDLLHLSSEAFNGRKTNSQGALKTAQYINKRFHSLGYQSQLQPFEYRSGFFSRSMGNNVIANLTTSNALAPQLIITAHYDHLGSKGGKYFPGANDNATGVSALLYLAQQLKVRPPNFNVAFVAVDAEENGLHGSQFYVSTLDTSTPLLNINLDMLGVKKRQPTLYAFTSRQQKQVVKNLTNLIATNSINIKVTSSTYHMNRLIKNNRIDWRKASDHYSFAKAGIGYIYFGMGDDKHHHKLSDDFASIDQTMYLETVLYIEKFIRKLDFADF